MHPKNFPPIAQVFLSYIGVLWFKFEAGEDQRKAYILETRQKGEP
jgi:hypothetical protein